MWLRGHWHETQMKETCSREAASVHRAGAMLSLSSVALFLIPRHGYWFLALGFQTSDRFSVVFSCDTIKWMVYFLFIYFLQKYIQVLHDWWRLWLQIFIWDVQKITFFLPYFIVARGCFNKHCDFTRLSISKCLDTMGQCQDIRE